VYSQESEPAITLTANVVEHTEYFQFAVTYNSKPSIDLTITGATVDGLVLEFSNCQTSAINVDAQNASTLGIHYNSDTLIYPSINLSGFNKDMVFVDSYNNGHPNLASMQTVGNAAQPGVTTINCLNWNDEDDADIIALLEGKGYVVIIE
jgi:hypothetical protein